MLREGLRRVTGLGQLELVLVGWLWESKDQVLVDEWGGYEGDGRAYLTIAVTGIRSLSILVLGSVGVPIVVGAIRIRHGYGFFQRF